jgi:hypothetical protein
MVRATNHMSPALERVLAPPPGAPPTTAGMDPRLDIAVVFTSLDTTAAALRKASDLATHLGRRITLVVPQIVPYPLPLTSPPVLLDWNEKRFRDISSESGVETTVLIYLCRDRREALATALSPRSLVVVGGRKRWWPTAEQRLARQLGRAGHQVIFTEMGGSLHA